MRALPEISVIMSVFNDENTLPAALESILSQEVVDLEFIVIDDGSTDKSGKIIDEFAARDSRLRIVHKQNEGLTRALIVGCKIAAAPWIARQDADDISLPGRLRAQLDRTLQPDAPVLIACGTLCRSPEGFEMYSNPMPREPGLLARQLLQDRKSIGAHGAVLFSRAAYEAVGGYRKEFYYAQDLDLFTRLAMYGPVASVSDVLYAYTFSPHSISAHSAAFQKKFRALIARADDCALYEADELSRKIRESSVRKADPFAGYYFIGSCLKNSNPGAAARYLRKALALKPWSLKTMARWVQSKTINR